MIVGGRGVGKKSSDNTTVPLCHPHHMELHALGDEFRFWEKHSINPLEWLDKNLDIFMEQRTKPTQKEKQCGDETDFQMDFGAFARRTDPETSHEAAAKVNVTKSRQKTLDALVEYGPMTNEEASVNTGIPLTSISPTFRPLARMGLIREQRNPDGTLKKKKGLNSNNMRIVWEIVE